MDCGRLEVNDGDVIVVYVGTFDVLPGKVDDLVKEMEEKVKSAFPDNTVIALKTRADNAKGVEFLILGKGEGVPKTKCMCG
jgi:translation elongation factor EF-1beta